MKGCESKGAPFVISAPSGTGKSTLIQKLRLEFPNIMFSVSCTSRAPRAGEKEGEDYIFVSRRKFERLRQEGVFAESAEVHGNYYGTPLAPVLECLDKGRDIIFDIDVQGARQLKESLPAACFIFIFPPSPREMLARLTGRGTDSPEVIAKRMVNAGNEIEQSSSFDYWIVNDDLKDAFCRLRAVYLAEKSKQKYCPFLAEDLLKQWEEADG